VWHWREDWARKLDTPPFKVCSQDLLLQLAFAAEEGAAPDAMLARVDLGKRHQRLAPSLAAILAQAVTADPRTLPRRPRTERHSLTAAEIARQDEIKEHRDRIAVKLALDPTLIANRAQLAEIARTPGKLGTILLPWQAELLADAPALRLA
jgi:ribonuclease D